MELCQCKPAASMGLMKFGRRPAAIRVLDDALHEKFSSGDAYADVVSLLTRAVEREAAAMKSQLVAEGEEEECACRKATHTFSHDAVVGVVVGVCCYLKKKKMADPSVKLPV